MLVDLHFQSKISIPTMSRWWKVAAAARKILLGLACFNLLRNLAPESSGSNAGAAAAAQPGGETDWHTEHGIRIRMTASFFRASSSIQELIVYLTGISVETHILAWLMGHEGQAGNARKLKSDLAIGRGGNQDHPFFETAKSKVDSVLQFVVPDRSPVWKSLENGAKMLNPEFEVRYWSLLWDYTAAGKSPRGIQLIWTGTVPLLARIWWRVAPTVRQLAVAVSTCFGRFDS